MAKSVENQISNLRPYVIALMKREGRDFTICELCKSDSPENRYDIHHTRYDGATYYDLRIVCRKCNHALENAAREVENGRISNPITAQKADIEYNRGMEVAVAIIRKNKENV